MYVFCNIREQYTIQMIDFVLKHPCQQISCFHRNFTRVAIYNLSQLFSDNDVHHLLNQEYLNSPRVRFLLTLSRYDFRIDHPNQTMPAANIHDNNAL